MLRGIEVAKGLLEDSAIRVTAQSVYRSGFKPMVRVSSAVHRNRQLHTPIDQLVTIYAQALCWIFVLNPPS